MHRIEEVVARGMCIGCGACAVATDGAIPISISAFGMYQADLDVADEEQRRRGSAVCPFSDESPNETELGAPTEAGRTLPFDARLGHVGQILAGRRNEVRDLPGSSSGGLTSWVIGQLLEQGHIDGVLHVGRAEVDVLFGYRVSHSATEVHDHRKSMYYSTTFAEVVRSVRGNGRRYAVVGVPCFITALRHLARTDKELDRQFVVYLGLVCGHLKSAFFAQANAWEIGVPPGDLAAVDFRVKSPDRPSSDYDFAALSRSTGEWKSAPTSSLVGGNWGTGAFQPEACNFCDDVFAETADAAFGDAWLPRYESDWRGTNVVVSRNALIDRILADGAERGDIDVEPISSDEAASSQAGNYRHRRLGLSIRLADDIAQGLSVPAKRVAPDAKAAPRRRRRLIRIRREMSRLSFRQFAAAKESGDLGLYRQPMREAWARYVRVDWPLHRRVVRKLRGRLRRGR